MFIIMSVMSCLAFCLVTWVICSLLHLVPHVIVFTGTNFCALFAFDLRQCFKVKRLGFVNISWRVGIFLFNEVLISLFSVFWQDAPAAWCGAASYCLYSERILHKEIWHAGLFMQSHPVCCWFQDTTWHRCMLLGSLERQNVLFLLLITVCKNVTSSSSSP